MFISRERFNVIRRSLRFVPNRFSFLRKQNLTTIMKCLLRKVLALLCLHLTCHFADATECSDKATAEKCEKWINNWGCGKEWISDYCKKSCEKCM